MRLTVFTSNQARHIALLDALAGAGHAVRAVIEPKAMTYTEQGVMGRYWARVRAAEHAVFPAQADAVIRGVEVVVLQAGELSAAYLPWDWTEQAHRFVVFSASYILGQLVSFLTVQNALHLHVGIAPEFRGSAPNFWAECLGRPDLVGAQVQRLSTGLDAGEILAEVRPPVDGSDPFLRGMVACRMGIEAIVRQVGLPPATWAPVRPNDRALQIADRRKNDFTPAVVESYLRRLDAAQS